MDDLQDVWNMAAALQGEDMIVYHPKEPTKCGHLPV